MSNQTGKELLSISEEISNMFSSIKRSTEDDDFDAGFKLGKREGLLEVRDIISKRIDEIIESEQKNNPRRQT